jgi:cardiolipin synthase
MKKRARLPRKTRILQKTFLSFSWWHIATLLVGFLSFISIIVVLFLPISKGPTKFTYTAAAPTISSPNFIRALSDSLNLPLNQGDAIQVLNNGNAFLEVLLNDIDGARSSINMMVYIWTEGQMSDRVLEKLTKKQREGVKVRIIVDSFGSNYWERPRKKFAALKAVGGEIAIFNSLTIAPWDFLKNHVRNHRRAIVVDGDVGYFGGMTISDPWLGDARSSEEYRDIMFRSKGPMAHHVQGVFSELWASMTGELLVGDVFFPPLPEAKEKRSVSYISLPSTPSPDTLILQKFVLLSLAGAEKTIYITSPYFLPDYSLREVLIRKAKEGLDVRVLVPNHLNDSRAVYHSSRDSYDELLAGGVKIYEYRPTFIHAKAIVVDSSWSIVGSANMDNRSRKINEEAIFGVQNTAFAAGLEGIFRADLDRADEIELPRWRQRSIWQRSQEVVFRNLIEQY